MSQDGHSVVRERRVSRCDPHRGRALAHPAHGPRAPRGVQDHTERMERPAKYLWTVHAEAAAVANAARSGARLNGATAFVTHMSCAGCARLMLNAGITCVVVGPGQTSMPSDEFEAAATMFEEAGVRTWLLDEGAIDT